LSETIQALLTGGYGDIGATTLSRFYIMHVCVLPLALVGLLAVHLSILQKTGSAGPVGGHAGPTHSFYPRQVVKDMIVALVGASALCIVAVFVTSTDTGPADPTPGNFVPRPEWYFLFHYQILKVLPQVVGAFLLPTAMISLLLALPFMDRSAERAPRRRIFATTAGAAVCLSIIGLTVQEIMTAPSTVDTPSAAASQEDPAEQGRTLFVEMKCSKCHIVAGDGGLFGPDLTHVASRLQVSYMRDWIRNPSNFNPETDMPAFEGSADQLDVVVEYLKTLK
jgi:ubiquinol-cytochrome c reductase cytochrome b subunit